MEESEDGSLTLTPPDGQLCCTLSHTPKDGATMRLRQAEPYRVLFSYQNGKYYVNDENEEGYPRLLERLRRVQAGEYTITEAVPLQELLDTAEPEKYLRSVDTMFRNYPAVTLTANQEKRCRNGNTFSVKLPEGTYRAYSQSGEFLMLAKVEAGVMVTMKSFFTV